MQSCNRSIQDPRLFNGEAFHTNSVPPPAGHPTPKTRLPRRAPYPLPTRFAKISRGKIIAEQGRPPAAHARQSLAKQQNLALIVDRPGPKPTQEALPK